MTHSDDLTWRIARALVQEARSPKDLGTILAFLESSKGRRRLAHHLSSLIEETGSPNRGLAGSTQGKAISPQEAEADLLSREAVRLIREELGISNSEAARLVEGELGVEVRSSKQGLEKVVRRAFAQVSAESQRRFLDSLWARTRGGGQSRLREWMDGLDAAHEPGGDDE